MSWYPKERGYTTDGIGGYPLIESGKHSAVFITLANDRLLFRNHDIDFRETVMEHGLCIQPGKWVSACRLYQKVLGCDIASLD